MPAYRDIDPNEVDQLIGAARDGDRGAWERLAWLYDPFVAKIARWYESRRPGCYDDAYQAGHLGLKRAIDKYDGAQAAFSTYATMHIHAAIQLEIRRQRGGRVGEHIQIVSRDDPDAQLGSYGAEDDEDVQQLCSRHCVIRQINAAVRSTITNGEEYVVAHSRMLADDPTPLREIGTILGRSRERVRQIEHTLMDRLSVVLHDIGMDDE